MALTYLLKNLWVIISKEAEQLREVVSKKNLSCMVGYQLRYHPAFAHIHKLITNASIGKIISADLHFGEYLPGMHSYEDYRDSHASRSEQGGGVILCLSHMVDIAYWLFGLPTSVYAKGGHLSSLEIDVEDTADIILECIDSDESFLPHPSRLPAKANKKLYSHYRRKWLYIIQLLRKPTRNHH